MLDHLIRVIVHIIVREASLDSLPGNYLEELNGGVLSQCYVGSN